jgi:hypothetical protein
VGHEGIHSSVGDYGSILTFVGPDGPNDPGAPDKPLAQFQTDVGGDAFLIVEGEQGSLFQWNTIFTAENLPRGFAYADPTGTEANAGLVIKEL